MKAGIVAALAVFQLFFSWTSHPGRYCVAYDGSIVAMLPQEWNITCGLGYATVDVSKFGELTRYGARPATGADQADMALSGLHP